MGFTTCRTTRPKVPLSGNRGALRTCMAKTTLPAARGALAMIAFVVAGSLGGVAGASAASNVCTSAGITTTVAVKYLGAGASAEYGTGYCRLLPRLSDGGDTFIEIDVHPKSQFQAQVNERGTTLQISGLGSKAVWCLNFGTLIFAAGSHAVVIGASGNWAPYPSKSKLIAIGHFVAAHVS